MFKKSKQAHQLNLFTNIRGIMSDSTAKIYDNKYGWHNQFREQVINRIDETPFKPLFSAGTGAPNASIRVLIGMCILKEAFGLSDSQLYEYCHCNILYKSALGLYNFDDPIPVESTYYLFRKRIVEYEAQEKVNLMDQVFVSITGTQLIDFNVSGARLRIDSTLLSSNITWYTRFELIYETLRVAYIKAKEQINAILSPADLDIMKEISGEAAYKVSYRSSVSDIIPKLTQYGYIIYTIIEHLKEINIEAIEILRRLFVEQYEVSGDVVTPLPKEKLTSASIQSPHDPDCHYHRKNDDEVKGYTFNVTETCSEKNNVNLITNVIVEPASVPDNSFVIPALKSTKALCFDDITTLNTDAAYYSFLNHEYCKESGIDSIIGVFHVSPSRFDYILDENQGLKVTDTKDNTIIFCRKVKTRYPETQPKWSFQYDSNKIRYVTKKDIDACEVRKQVALRTKEELNRRCNVESTIYQLVYHYPHKKSKYRGISKHRIWANLRCMWINFKRILKYIVSQRPKIPILELTNA